MQLETGRRGGRASEKAGTRDLAMDKARDSFGGELQELEDKLKSGMITKKEYDRYIMKMENPDAEINYEPSGYEKSGTETRENIAGHDEEEWDDHDIEEEIDSEFADDDTPGAPTHQSTGMEGEDEEFETKDFSQGEGEEGWKHHRGGYQEQMKGEDDYDMEARGLDDNDLETKKRELKEMVKNGLIMPQEHDKQLREIMPSINFKSTGAVRAKDGRWGGRASDRSGSRDADVAEAQTEAYANMATDPLTAKGNKIMSSMQEEYGPKKGKSVFYASKNKGNISGVE